MNGSAAPPPPPGAPPPPPPRDPNEPHDRSEEEESARPERRRGPILIFALAVLVIIAAGVGSYLALRDDSGDDSEVILQPTTTAGEDPFTDSVASARVSELTSNGDDIAGDPVSGVSGGDRSIESVEGSAPGLYGGTEREDACDPDALVDFLEDNPAKAAAWAEAQGIDTDEIDAYVSTLTPVILREDTRVTNNGFADGQATPFQAVLQAGTAVLVDDRGIPRVRCACGNPLSEAEATDSEPDYSGEEWSRFDKNRLVSVSPAPEKIDRFRLVDVRTGEEFERAAGSQDLLFAQDGTLQRVGADRDGGKPKPLPAGEFDGTVDAISAEVGATATVVTNPESSAVSIQTYSAADGMSVLVTSGSSIADVQVVDDRVFWTGTHGLGSVGLDGSDPLKNDIRLPQQNGGSVAEGLAYDGEYIYFTRCIDGTIGRVRPDGSELDTAFITLFDACPQALDVADGRLYWTDLGGGESYDVPRISRASTGGGDVLDPWFQTDDELGPIGVAVSGQHVFWAHGTGVAGGETYVGRVNLDGTGAVPDFLATSYYDDPITSAIAVPHPAPAEEPEPLTITEQGVGDLTLGISLPEAESSELVAETVPGCELGGPGPKTTILAPPLQGSAEFYAPDGEGEIELSSMAVSAGVATEEGITIGSTADEVIAAYPDARVEPGTAGDILDQSEIVLGSQQRPRISFLLNHDDGVVTTIGVPFRALCE